MHGTRALLVGPLPPPVGGDTIMTSDLQNSRYWPEFGITVDVVNTSPGGGVRLPDERLSAGDFFRGVKVVSSVLTKLHRADFVLLWANSRFLCTAGLAVIIAANIFARPVIAKCFGAFIAERIESMNSLRRRVVKDILGRCRLILPETVELRNRLIEKTGIPASKVRQFPNYIPDRYFDDPAPSARQDTKDRADHAVIKCVFVGQVKKTKGVFEIIEALGNKPHTSCDFYGPLVQEDAAEFTARIGSSDNLQYLGVAQKEHIPSLLRRYDVLLLPTWHKGEGYPAVVLQAFASRLPVVATNWRSIPDLLGNNERGILVPVADADAIARAVERLGSDRELSKRIADNAYEYSLQFSEKAVVRDLLIKTFLDFA